MLETISEPVEDLKETVPRIETIITDTEKIRDVIGTGGKVIKGIQDETSATIEIQEDGTVHVAATSKESTDDTKQMINSIVHDPEVGEIYSGKIASLKDFGAFVNLTPLKDGLLPISKL